MSNTDRPLKVLEGVISQKTIRNTASGKTLIDVRVQENSEQKRPAIAIGWEEVADGINQAISAEEVSLDDNITVRFEGWWKKNNWTNNNGAEQTTWQFQIQKWSVNGESGEATPFDRSSSGSSAPAQQTTSPAQNDSSGNTESESDFGQFDEFEGF